IHYLGVTAMTEPGLCVPAQWPSARRLRAGDALTCEVSASYHGYPGQLLRTFAIAAPPAPLYRDLHRVAEAAFDTMAARLRAGATAQDLVAAAAEIILPAGSRVWAAFRQGSGGGSVPRVISGAALESGGAAHPGRPRRHPPGRPGAGRTAAKNFTFAAGMTVVIQPNVITPDERAGVQT